MVDEEEIKNGSNNVPHHWFRKRQLPVILAAGRLSRVRGFDVLIDAFGKINSKIDARLIILGEGPLRKTLENQVKNLGLTEKVLMPGMVNNVYDYMHHASVFVLSSRWEVLPTVLIEAMACRCPVLSTDCPSGPAEILENGKYGELVPVGNPSLLAEAIMKTLSKKTDKEMLKSRAMDFSVKNSVEKYVEVLKL